MIDLSALETGYVDRLQAGGTVCVCWAILLSQKKIWCGHRKWILEVVRRAPPGGSAPLAVDLAAPATVPRPVQCLIDSAVMSSGNVARSRPTPPHRQATAIDRADSQPMPSQRSGCLRCRARPTICPTTKSLLPTGPSGTILGPTQKDRTHEQCDPVPHCRRS